MNDTTSLADHAGRTRTFPDGFQWGAATAAYQVEGAAAVDGRAPSIWDLFCRRPGTVHEAQNGDTAADHYHRYEQDIELMAQLGLGAYRFSVSWSRVLPDGRGTVNPLGLAFYDRLVDALLAKGITPVLTLYHWDLPQALENRGGWVHRDTPFHFAEYAQVMASALGDRVGLWVTINEPWCAAFLGHAAGIHAPGLTDRAQSFAAAHHLLLAHGLGVQAVRAAAPRPVRMSIALNLSPISADGRRPEDLDCARRVDGALNRMFLDPVLRGGYPSDVVEDASRFTDWSFVRNSDERVIGAPIDLLGVNYYSAPRVSAGEATLEPTPWPTARHARFADPYGQVTAMGWGIDADGLLSLLTRLNRDYPGVPLAITENGAAFDDEVRVGDEVHDSERVAYLARHLAMAHHAIREGVLLEGYFVWSLLDNFEWTFGYTKRFGLVHVDFATQQRRLKESAHWYREVIAANALPG